MRDLLAVLYVVGAILTAAGVVIAYRRARRDLHALDGVATLLESHEDIDIAQEYEDSTAGNDAAVAEREARRAVQQEQLDRAVAATGLRPGGPTWKDFGLPMEYWAKRSALRDAVASFKTGGILAVTGLSISTVASVWSLYLPAA